MSTTYERVHIMSRNHSCKLRVWESSALCALSITMLICLWAQREQTLISSSLIRLHVLAVSDEADEQEIKLRVRDAVIDYLSPILSGVSAPEEAHAVIEREQQGIKEVAESAAEGRRVTVSLGDERYPTRSYGGFTLPAGRYSSLRVTLGEGRGHNWWCVVFPPICLDNVSAEDIRPAMADEAYSIVAESDEYEIRFKIVELWGELAAMLRS